MSWEKNNSASDFLAYLMLLLAFGFISLYSNFPYLRKIEELTEEERLEVEKEYNMFSDEQANKIAIFYDNNKENISTLICQCEHGQSRSAAVAAAIFEFRSRRGIQIFADDRYFPNKVVFRKVLKAIQST